SWLEKRGECLIMYEPRMPDKTQNLRGMCADGVARIGGSSATPLDDCDADAGSSATPLDDCDADAGSSATPLDDCDARPTITRRRLHSSSDVALDPPNERYRARQVRCRCRHSSRPEWR